MNKFVKGLLVAGVALSIGGVGFTAVTTQAHAASVQSADTTAKINALIQEKQELINKKKISTNWQEQQALGIRIGEIEREIQALKNGSSRGSSTGSSTTPSTPVEDNTAKIAALIQEKQELVNKKKASRDKNEQKALGKQIDAIEKEIKQLKKNK